MFRANGVPGSVWYIIICDSTFIPWTYKQRSKSNSMHLAVILPDKVMECLPGLWYWTALWTGNVSHSVLQPLFSDVLRTALKPTRRIAPVLSEWRGIVFIFRPTGVSCPHEHLMKRCPGRLQWKSLSKSQTSGIVRGLVLHSTMVCKNVEVFHINTYFSSFQH
jgi:hypothetical protein